MADLLNHSITQVGDLTVAQLTALIAAGGAVHRFQIAAKVVDSQTQKTTLADLTGANSVDFILRVSTLTLQDHLDLIHLVAAFIINRTSGQG